jgi:hypothetical protein
VCCDVVCSPLLVVLVIDTGSSVIIPPVIGCARVAAPDLPVRKHD